MANAIDALSGDQKCPPRAPSVPASGRASVESRGRSHSCRLPAEVPTRATWRPSGDTATGLHGQKARSSGVSRTKWAAGRGSGVRVRRWTRSTALSVDQGQRDGGPGHALAGAAAVGRRDGLRDAGRRSLG